MDKDKLKGVVASELIIVAMETKNKRPTQLNFEEMIDVVSDVVNKIPAYSMLGAVFIPTSNRVPKDEYRLIAIDIYGRYVMEHQKNKNTIVYCTEDQFRSGYQKCT